MSRKSPTTLAVIVNEITNNTALFKKSETQLVSEERIQSGNIRSESTRHSGELGRRTLIDSKGHECLHVEFIIRTNRKDYSDEINCKVSDVYFSDEYSGVEFRTRTIKGTNAADITAKLEKAVVKREADKDQQRTGEQVQENIEAGNKTKYIGYVERFNLVSDDKINIESYVDTHNFGKGYVFDFYTQNGFKLKFTVEGAASTSIGGRHKSLESPEEAAKLINKLNDLF
ncbi:hypothetical protein VCHA53O466_320058 [Vibrio chagasii]|nr:hypothetical protein VCHA53O466_320058 [Vibrio chagasii]